MSLILVSKRYTTISGKYQKEKEYDASIVRPKLVKFYKFLAQFVLELFVCCIFFIHHFRTLAHSGKELNNPFLKALAQKEEANRSGKMTVSNKHNDYP